MALIFVTSNVHKFNEVSEIAAGLGIEIKRADIRPVEIQADTLEEVASYSAKEAASVLRKPCFVEDAGLFIKALNGFPGPYSNFVFRTVGNDGILKLMDGEGDRRAEFRSAIAYCAPGGKPKVFSGKADGAIAINVRGKRGFGFDPIFLIEETNRTFGEMETEEKNRFSHRASALKEFLKWYRKIQP